MLFQDRPVENIQDLYDREKELEALKRSMKERAITLVIGFRRTGKTSLIKVASSDSKLNIIYIDARKFETENYITYRNLMEEFAKGLNSLIPRHKRILDFLRNISSIKINELSIEFSWGKERVSLASILEELNNWAEKENEKLVIIIDEIQELIKLKGFNLIPIIAYAYDNLRNISFVFAGSKVGMLYNFLKIEDATSPLYGRYMEKIEIKPLSYEQSIDFLTKGFREVNIKPNRKILEKAVEELDGIIGWLSYFGLMALSEGLNEKTLNIVLENASKIVINEFYNFIKSRNSKRYLEILKATKNGATWSEIKRYLEIKTGEKIYDYELTRLLKNLADSAFIEKKNNLYKIPDPILRYAINKI